MYILWNKFNFNKICILSPLDDERKDGFGTVLASAYLNLL